MKFHLLALAMLAINSASGGVYARASDEQSTSTQSSLRGMFLNEDEAEASASMRKLKRGNDDGKERMRMPHVSVFVFVCEISLILLLLSLIFLTSSH